MTARGHSISSSAGACVLASLCVRTAVPSHNTGTPRHCNLLPSWADRQMLEAAKYIQYLRFDVAFVVAHYLALTMSSPFACAFEVIKADKLRCCIMGRYILSLELHLVIAVVQLLVRPSDSSAGWSLSLTAIGAYGSCQVVVLSLSLSLSWYSLAAPKLIKAINKRTVQYWRAQQHQATSQ